MKVIVWLLAFFAFHPVFSQIFQDEVTANFAYQVKQIDEFIERFNNKENTLIKQYVKKKDTTAQFKREQMIKGLFNASDTSWKKAEILQFIGQVSNAEDPVYLNFFDANWYAEVNCAASYKGKPTTITLILKIQREKNGMSKWIVVSAIADFLRLPIRKDTTTGLNPLSHATDFMNIDLLTTDKKNIRNYLPNHYQDEVLSVFLYEAQHNQLAIKQVNKITYHFLQIDGWIFTVNRFSRQTRNSGWLLSKLLPVTVDAKQKYAHEKLSLPDEMCQFQTSYR